MAYGLVLLVLTPVVAILGLAIFAVLAIVVFGPYALLGEPKVLAPLIGLGWFFGSLAVLFLVLRRGHRWLTRLLALADAPTRAIDPIEDEPTMPSPSPIASPSLTLQERLAAADARLAPPQSQPEPRHEPPK
jgi:hypothetical protein